MTPPRAKRPVKPSMAGPLDGFAQQVVAWQRLHGRHDLPWQATQDPYAVWLSEIMLQQTQVVTAKDYFRRFIARYPTVYALATASLDDVLGLWSGLGYYTRARNLHACAQAVVRLHGGAFPRDAINLETLPGIGRSTAAAIASLCFGERVAILDANVKRVLTRVLGFDADLALATNERTLWQLANGLVSDTSVDVDMPRYTQGMMDLGATLCTPKNPRCGDCPVRACCQGHRSGAPERYPVRSRKLKRSSQSLWLLWAQAADGAVYLAKRPTPGVWAGLYCLPLFDSELALHHAVPQALQGQLKPLPVLTHVLTHKDLHLHPWLLPVPDTSLRWGVGRWVDASAWPGLGLPAPIRKMLAA